MGRAVSEPSEEAETKDKEYMIRLSFIFLLIYFSKICLSAPVLNIPNFENLNLKLSVDGGSQWGEQKRTIFLREKLFLSLDYEFSPQYEMKNELFLEFRKGSFQHLSNEGEGSPFDVNYSILSIKNVLVENLYLNIGFINQGYLEASLLLYDRPFVGFQQEYFWTDRLILQYVDEFKFVFQQTLPSTTMIVDRFDQLRDISSLLTASAFTSSFLLDKLHSRAHLTGFIFNNLSVQAAQYGGVNGNDLKKSNYSSKYTEFRDPYWGIHAGVGTHFNVFLDDLGVEIQYNFLWNIGAFVNRYFTETPIDSTAKKRGSRSRGDSLKLDLRFPLSIDKLFIFGTEIFRNQNNASVAFYSDNKYGGSARFGVIFSSQFLFKAHNILLDFQYGAIQSYSDKRHLLQGGRNLNYFGFEIRTEYGKI